MQTRLAFLAGAAVSYWFSRGNPAAELAFEASLLRDEVREARVLVQELVAGQNACEWEIWRQKWLLRFGAVLDLLLVGWIVWSYIKPKPVIRQAVIADTGSTTESDSGEPLSKQQLVPAKGNFFGKGVISRGGPSRPSDFRGGKK